MVWLGLVASHFYTTKLGYLMGEIQWPVAIIFYLVFLVGLTLFVTYPAAQNESVLQALCMGALFGFFTYATYDLTNLSTIRDWPLSVSLVDMVWGTVLGSVVSSVTVFVYGWLS
jgi:uncharacterized membrane protein